jgi:hypothetical protein
VGTNSLTPWCWYGVIALLGKVGLNHGMKRLLGIFLALAYCLIAQAEVKLFENNRWQGPIVIPQNAELDEWYAGQTLATWCEIVTGRRPEIFEESPNKKTPEVGVFVGRTQATLSAKVSAPAGDGDTAIRTTIEGRVFLLGNNPTATRIAVGRFCEQHLGITFAFPDIKGADWAPLKAVALPAPDLFQPKFAWRDMGTFRSGTSQEWCRLVGYGQSPQFGHTFYEAFSKEYWQASPTLLANLGNGPLVALKQEYSPNPNLAHPDAAIIGAAYAFHFLEKYPAEFCAPLGVNDTTDFDRSAVSEGWYRERPVRTDYLIKFLNRVAQEKWRPADGTPHAIGTLAYLHTQRAPTIPAHPDIFPFVCADRMAYANRAFAVADADNLIAWKKSGIQRLGIYDYWHGSSQCVPRINFTAQSLAIKTASDSGATAWKAEMGPIWAFDAPKAWLGAKLLIDPSADADALLTKWFEAAYGPGAESMRETYRMIEGAWSRDAINGGPNQWLRHFLDEDGTWVLSDDEVALISKSVDEANRTLAQSGAATRIKNQRWRLDQFRQTWELVLAFREVVRARQSTPLTPEAALLALQNLVKLEGKYKVAQDAYNAAWGVFGQPVQWLQFVPSDPRSTWLNLISQNKNLRTTTATVIKNDTTGLSVLMDFWNQHTEQVKVLSAPQDFDAFNREWKVELSGKQFSEVDYHEGILSVHRDAGTLRYKTPIQPGEIVQLSVQLGEPTEAVQLSLNFLGGIKGLRRSVQYTKQSNSAIMMVPKDATEVEFEIVFKDNINLTSLKASRLNPRDLHD